MSPKLDPYLGRRQKLTPYSKVGRRLKGVYFRICRRLQIGLLLGAKPGAGRPVARKSFRPYSRDAGFD